MTSVQLQEEVDGVFYEPSFEREGGQRVKSVSFHGTQPWLAVAYHSGDVMMWDVMRGERLWQYAREHEGPVRSVACHPQLPMVATGGDDALVKVWPSRGGGVSQVASNSPPSAGNSTRPASNSALSGKYRHLYIF
jgi:WD40 repeat protein